MPLSKRNVMTGGDVYVIPWLGPVDHTTALRVTAAGIGAANLDDYGYVPPGCPLAADGTLVGAGQQVYGATVEAVKIAKSNSAADVAAAGPVDLAVGTIGQLVREKVEDNLGRALTADEEAGFEGSGIRLI